MYIDFIVLAVTFILLCPWCVLSSCC